jgi:SAM-dependent methyltransferase
MSDIRPISSCRLCGSQNLERALKLADIPVADRYTKRPEVSKLYPCELWLCMDCGHAQMGHMMNPDLMFRDYRFHSGDSPSFVRHLRAQAHTLQTDFGPSTVLEIGSNDGSLLAEFQNVGCSAIGVDPCNVVTRDRTHTIREYFTAALADQIVEQYGRFDMIVANHVFAHADDLGDMLDGVRKCLAPKGVFVFENAYVLDLVEQNYYDQIYHEHPSFHAVGPLMSFCEAHGMEVFEAERNDCKGGSIRGFVQHRNGPHPTCAGRLAELLSAELRANCGSTAGYRGIERRIEEQRKALPVGRMVGYGASSSCTPVIYNLELQDRLAYLVDDNPRKQSTWSPGACIPVNAPDAIKDEPWNVVILAIRYAEQIAKKLNGKAVVLP